MASRTELVSARLWPHHRVMVRRCTLARKEIRLPCTLELAGSAAGLLAGQTRDLAEREAAVQIPALGVPGRKRPVLGSTGVLTLSFVAAGGRRETLKIPCRVAHVTGNVVGVQLNVVALIPVQKELFVHLLDRER